MDERIRVLVVRTCGLCDGDGSLELDDGSGRYVLKRCAVCEGRGVVEEDMAIEVFLGFLARALLRVLGQEVNDEGLPLLRDSGGGLR